MNHAELCPVCKGNGVVEGDKKCHGCDGKGWVTVQGEWEAPWYPWFWWYPGYPQPEQPRRDDASDGTWAGSPVSPTITTGSSVVPVTIDCRLE